MATGQVLFRRFYCKKSLAKFDVNDFLLQTVAASCVWLASKLEENPKKARQVITVFNRMECRRENLPLDHLDLFSKVTMPYCTIIMCHLECFSCLFLPCKEALPFPFISFFLTLGELRDIYLKRWIFFVMLNILTSSFQTSLPHLKHLQNLGYKLGTWLMIGFRADISSEVGHISYVLTLRTTLCVRFRSEVVALCLAHLYSLPKAQYISVCKDGKPFTFSSSSGNPQAQSATKVRMFHQLAMHLIPSVRMITTTPHEKAAYSKKSDAESNSLPIVGDSRQGRLK
ncbi:hypothetical protein Bca4012_062652 [Brassica carinata]